MANNNETVEHVCEKMKEPSVYKGRFPASFFDGEFCEFADRILAAHNREIADFQRRYDECVRKFNEADLERVRLRDEVAAMDAEIDLLRLLVKELEDAASENMTTQCLHCDLRDACQEGEDGMVVPCNQVIKLREALEKAREVCK